ncbi:MAG: hypothetical protein GY832_05545 [Chloroflexi bacterium]|nr:hypothetical protein [Chloroflexota bacterium]
MSTDARADFASEFLDDYFAECDEHLMTMRRVLLVIEPFVHQPPVDRSLLDALFRSLHSIKGLSGMVGVSVAEELAYQMESYLRALRRKQLALTAEGMDALIAGARTLESVIAACRAQQPPPDTAPILAQFASILGTSSETQVAAEPAAPAPPATTLTVTSTPLALNEQESARLDTALEDGMQTWCVEFTPAPALAERGVTVDGIRARLQDIGTVFERMRFVVHDLTRESQKQVTLELSGQETEIDKLVVEQMMDPLMHLVRNAVSHGLESTEERVAQGKPPEARIALRAGAVGDAVLIEIEDDGQGIDTDRVLERARSLGLIDAADLTLTTDTLLDILCAPGFSTREQADRVSGRGVRMAVVKNAVEKLGGSLALDTQIGQGTCFTIQLPLTLAITDALIVSASGQTFAVPMPLVREVIEVQPTQVTLVEKLAGNEILSYRGGVWPIVRLARYFGLTSDAAAQPDDTTERAFYVLVVGEVKPVGIAIDRVLSQREIVVRATVDPLIQVPGIAGATELGDGRPILILDIAALTRVKRKT